MTIWLLKIRARPRRDKLNTGCASAWYCSGVWKVLSMGLVRAMLTLSLSLFQLLSSKTAYLNRTWMK